MGDQPSPFGIRKNADLLMSLGKMGVDWDAARTQGKLGAANSRAQAAQQQGNLSNQFFDQSQVDAKNRFDTLSGMTNFTEQLDRRNRQDQLLRQLVAKNPRLGNLSGVLGTPEQRQRNMADDVWKESAAAAEYLRPEQWNERYDTGVLQNLLTGDPLGPMRDSIMRTGQDTLKNQGQQRANWQENQTSTAQQVQAQLDQMARAQDKTGLASRIGLLLSVLGGAGKLAMTGGAGAGAV